MQKTMQQTEYAVQLNHLNHFYGRKQILFDLNTKLVPNRIYGLLGRNGAGKTTLINILSAQIFQKSGEALVFGHAAFEHADTLSKICFIREKSHTPDALRVSQALKTASMIYPNWDNEYAQKLTELFALDPKKKFKSLSRGMESALGLVIGLASRAELTVFDEPSLGLDAAAREYFYDEVIRDFEAHPRTIIISTHMIDEVARLFEDVVIIDRGRILCNSPLDKLMSKAVCISGPDDAVTAAIDAVNNTGRTTIAEAADGIQYNSPRIRIIHKEEIGNLCLASVWCDDGIDQAWFNTPDSRLEVNPLPLQRLFVYMTEGGIF